MAEYEYDDFWVEFSPRAGGGYDVAARAPDGTTSRGGFELPFTSDQLETAVRTLGYTRAATTRDIGEVTTERQLTAVQLGGQLASALLAGGTGALYTTARGAAASKGRGIRLWLSLEKAPGLLNVPWEFLYVQPTFLASQRKSPIVRFLKTDAPVEPRRIEEAVRILGVVASPSGYPRLEVAEERKHVDEALGKARQDREVTIDWLDPATPRALRLALQKGDYHILHFIGHSDYIEDGDATNGGGGGGGGGVILLENDDHSAAPVSDVQLVNLLGDQDSLRLVVLNSCEGARTSVVDPFAGIATSIVALGIPAVVAMQFEISDKAAIAFAQELYQSLIARQEPIDVAVAEARKAVFTEVNQTEWATPVLFLRNEDGRLFDFAPVVVTDTHREEAPPLPVTAPVTVPARPPAWLMGVGAVAVLALLFGGAAALGAFGGPTPSPSGSAGAFVASASPSASNVPPTQPPSAPPTQPPSVPPTQPAVSVRPTASYEIVPGTKTEWVGPRPKSGLLAVAGGPSRTITNISTVHLPKPGATPRPAGVATDLVNVFDLDPAWDPHRGVIAFTRFENGSAQIKYVVPGVGQRPDGKTDQGISVKDPILETPERGTWDHVPAWRGDGNLLFSRSRACDPRRPDPLCLEDIVLSTFDERIDDGEYIVPIDQRPATVGADWSDVRNISVDPLDDERFLVTGRDESPGNRQFGVWVVRVGGSRALLPGSENAARAIFGPGGMVVAIERGSLAGWGPVLLVWPTVDAPEPERVDAAAVLGLTRLQVPSADSAQFSSISPSPLGDGRFAVLVADSATLQARGLPTIILLDSRLRLTEVVETLPPPRPTWKTLIALGW